MIKFAESTKLLLEEAKKKGIKVKVLYSGLLTLLTYKKHKEYLYKKTMRLTSSLAVKICSNKEATKIILKEAGISVAKDKLFEKNQEQQALEYAEKIGFPVVIKNPAGSEGKLVYPEIKNKKEFHNVWLEICSKLPLIMVEKHIYGPEYRITTTKNKVIAALLRVPANITGDGKHTVEQLVKTKNIERLKISPIDLIVLGDAEKEVLAEKKLTFKSIPQKNQIVYLRKNSNISTGGDSYDYTNKIHPSVKQIALKIINAIPDLQYAGIDIISKDITQKQNKNTYAIIEVNSYPDFDGHHRPYYGKPRNVAKEIVDILFPETKQTK